MFFTKYSIEILSFSWTVEAGIVKLIGDKVEVWAIKELLGPPLCSERPMGIEVRVIVELFTFNIISKSKRTSGALPIQFVPLLHWNLILLM